MEPNQNDDENRRELDKIPESTSLVKMPAKNVIINDAQNNHQQIAATTTANNYNNHNNSSITKKQQNNIGNGKEEEFDADDWELVPPDGGWGWLVLFGATLVNILIPGTIKSFGVLFVEFIEAFEATPAKAAWIPALCYFLYSSLGPLSSVLSVKYSFKTVTIIGGTFAAVGMMLTYFANSITYLYVSYGVMVGIGAGLSFPPTVYIVTSYFLKLRGLANGICISGSAIGSIILPPVLRILLEQFGYRGAVLIMGALTLNVWVAAIFYHPVEQHLVRVRKHKDIDENEIGEKELEMIDAVPHTKPKFVIAGSDETPSSTPKTALKADEVFILENGFGRSVSTANHNNMSPSSSFYAAADNRFSTASRLGSRSRFGQAPPKRSPSTSSFNYISTPYHGSTLAMVHPNEFASHLSLRSITEHLSPSCSKATKLNDEKERNKFFDLSLLKDPMYLVILISNSTNAIGYTNFIILLPSYAITLGFDKSLAAYLISIVSALDLVGRIGGSALSDTELIPKTWYFVGGLTISGAALAVLPFAQSYRMLSVCCSIFGLASGVYVGITAVIMADMLGTERLTSSYGISLFVNGILQLIGPPLCGLWFSMVQSYGPLFHTLGIVLLLGASLWGLMPGIVRRKKHALAAKAANVDI